jgi:hypothetical protein
MSGNINGNSEPEMGPLTPDTPPASTRNSVTDSSDGSMNDERPQDERKDELRETKEASQSLPVSSTPRENHLYGFVDLHDDSILRTRNPTTDSTRTTRLGFAMTSNFSKLQLLFPNSGLAGYHSLRNRKGFKMRSTVVASNTWVTTLLTLEKRGISSTAKIGIERANSWPARVRSSDRSLASTCCYSKGPWKFQISWEVHGALQQKWQITHLTICNTHQTAHGLPSSHGSLRKLRTPGTLARKTQRTS